MVNDFSHFFCRHFQTGHRRNIHDRPLVRGNQKVRQHGMGDIHDTSDVRSKYRLNVRERLFPERMWSAKGDAGIVNENVNRVAFFSKLLDGRNRLWLIADVTFYPGNVARRLAFLLQAQGLFNVAFRAAEENEVATFEGQLMGDGKSNPDGSASDQDG